MHATDVPSLRDPLVNLMSLQAQNPSSTSFTNNDATRILHHQSFKSHDILVYTAISSKVDIKLALHYGPHAITSEPSEELKCFRALG